jgi:hypothetical protein
VGIQANKKTDNKRSRVEWYNRISLVARWFFGNFSDRTGGYPAGMVESQIPKIHTSTRFYSMIDPMMIMAVLVES